MTGKLIQSLAILGFALFLPSQPLKAQSASATSNGNSHRLLSFCNDAGTIAGFFRYGDKIDHGFIYSRGVFSQVDVAGASATNLFRIKNNGNIVGVATDARQESHGVIGR